MPVKYQTFLPTIRKPAGSVLGLLILTVILGAALVRAEGPNRVGLIVVHNDQVIKKCVEFSEETITGYDVLERSGLDFNVDLSNSMGAAICRIDGQGCTYPAEDCFCRCQGSPCFFWSYWHLDGDAWRFSGLGTSNYEVGDGDVEGWVWGEGSPNRGGSLPPPVSFAEICALAPTPTPTNTPLPPTATPTLTPTYTPAPTDTPQPTGTPVPTPQISHFTADRTTISAGETALLSWNLSGAQAAYLRYNGVEEGVIAPGSKTVSPATTTIYTLIARNEGGESRAEITVIVNPAAPEQAVNVAAAPSPSPTAVPSVPAEVIAVPTATPSIPATSTPGPTVQLPASATPPPVAGPPSPEPAGPVTLTAPPPATEVAAEPAVTQLQPLSRREFQAGLAGEPASDRPDRARQLVAYGGLVIVLGLFLAAPVVLLGVGWLAWWLRRRQ